MTFTETSAPVGTRTPNLLFRRQMLYPIELQAQTVESRPLLAMLKLASLCWSGQRFALRGCTIFGGEMAERTIASVLKTVEALRSPGVRIPLSPLDPEGRRKAALRPF